MSFREKTAWISIVSIGGIYGVYFWSVMRAGRQGTGAQFGGLLGTVIALVVVQVVLTTIAAIMAPREANAAPDERDRLIDLRATRTAYAGLATGIACACFFGAFTPPIVFKVNSLLFILVTAELLRCGSQVVQYRRGA
jgi:hypothetical protein